MGHFQVRHVSLPEAIWIINGKKLMIHGIYGKK
jgi:hypothetical protein